MSCFREAASIYGSTEDNEENIDSGDAGGSASGGSGQESSSGSGSTAEIYVEEIDNETEQDFLNLERALSALKKSEKSLAVVSENSATKQAVVVALDP